MKAVKALLFIPISFLFIYGVTLAFTFAIIPLLNAFLGWLSSFHTWSIVLILLFFGGFIIAIFSLIWALFKTLVEWFSRIVAMLSPGYMYAFIINTVLAVSNAVYFMYRIWVNYPHNNVWLIIQPLIVSALILEFSVSIIIGSFPKER